MKPYFCRFYFSLYLQLNYYQLQSYRLSLNPSEFISAKYPNNLTRLPTCSVEGDQENQTSSKRGAKRTFDSLPPSGRKQHLIAGLRFPDSLSQAKEIGCLPKESPKKKIMSQKMAYLKSANANRNFKIAISLLNNMANLPEVEVLADIKLEFMECCKYELPDPGLKIPYLFMKPIFSSGGGNTRTTIQQSAV